MQTNVCIATLKHSLPVPTAPPYGKISTYATYLQSYKLRSSYPYKLP
jgi:hypothetical protein